MGALIPSPNDQQICAALSNRFSDMHDPNAEAANLDKTMLGSVRFQDQKESGLLFSRRLNLARLAHRLSSAPANQAARLRWFFLLRRGLPHATKVAISAVLNAVMGDSSIKQVHFDAVHDSTITTEFELDPNNSHVPQTRNMPSMANPAQNVKTCVMLLRCFYDEPLPDPQNEPDPPAANNAEATPIIIA
ncbi:hypothetical protein [Bradyrhizobium sp. Ce-3]|uniref:hypothetical protein n=1 Tax=Bradyrhizobium sp. Ce-3 TaxID=2913970 RepID=UPI001FC81BE3|nr:hypothetical protein [Bradyrhizobium sp. Ce-3]GKQ55284.1 hypothetical protein BRSPCE3_61390 [Bradyrhizobium sp. Ce-3]